MAATYSFKADPELHDAIKNLMKSDGLTASQAIRLLLGLGLVNVNKLDEQWRKLALREGRFEGINAFREALKRASDEVI